MRFLHSLPLFCVLALARVPLPAQQPDKKVDEVKKPDKPTELLGKLTEQDPRTTVEEGNVRVQSPYKTHAIKLLAGKGYQIELSPREKSMHCYLRVEDSTGKVQETDDDSSGELSARLIFHPEKDDDFHLVATCWYGTGEYMIRVTQVDIPNIKAAAGVTHRVGKGGLAVNAELANNDPRDTRRRVCFAKIYQVKMFKGKTYTIDMVSNRFDTYLRIETLAGKQLAEDDDSGGQLNARISFRPTENAVYRVIGTSFDPNAVGAFTLTVREQ